MAMAMEASVDAPHTRDRLGVNVTLGERAR